MPADGLTYGTPFVVGQVAAAAANTLVNSPPAGQWIYLTSVDVFGLGATATTNVTFTIVSSITLSYSILVPAGVTTPITPIQLRWNPGIKGPSAGGGFTISIPSFGAGNTQTCLNIAGYYL